MPGMRTICEYPKSMFSLCMSVIVCLHGNLKLTTNQVYLDERHLDWMSDLVLQHVIADLRPRFVMLSLRPLNVN